MNGIEDEISKDSDEALVVPAKGLASQEKSCLKFVKKLRENFQIVSLRLIKNVITLSQQCVIAERRQFLFGDCCYE